MKFYRIVDYTVDPDGTTHFRGYDRGGRTYLHWFAERRLLKLTAANVGHLYVIEATR